MTGATRGDGTDDSPSHPDAPVVERSDEERARALKLWVVLARAYGSIAREVEADIGRHDLTTTEFGILEALHHKGPLLLGEIQRKVLVTSGGITYLVDRLVAKGLNETKVRKTVLVTGMFFGLAVFGATRTTSPNWAIFWISVSLGGLAAAAPVCWSMPSLIAPKGGVATVAGIMNFSNNIAGAIAPIATGLIVASTHSFTNAFLVADVILVLGIMSIVFVMGKIEPIPDRAD